MIDALAAFNIVTGKDTDSDTALDFKEFLRQASARNLQDFLILCTLYVGPRNLASFVAVANTALQIRLSEDERENTKQLVDISNGMTANAGQQLKSSQGLSAQTQILVNESKDLSKLTASLKRYTIVLTWLTIGVLAFTVILFVIDSRGEKESEQRKDEVIAAIKEIKTGNENVVAAIEESRNEILSEIKDVDGTINKENEFRNKLFESFFSTNRAGNYPASSTNSPAQPTNSSPVNAIQLK